MFPFFYSAFGLTFACEFEFPELFPLPNNSNLKEPDVVILFGDVPEHLENPNFANNQQETSIDQYLVKFDETLNVRYLVQNGNEIIVQCLHGCELDVMRLFLLSYCMTAIAIQRGRIPIHASGIRVNQDAILFSGASGRGKSTLAANFLKRGYEIITDDVAVLDFNVNGLPLVVPGYPRIKLWEDSLENLGESPEIYQRVRAGVDKYGIPLFKGYASNPLPIMAIYLLDESQSSQIQIDPIHGFERYLALKNNIFGKRILFMMNSIRPNGNPGERTFSPHRFSKQI